MKFRAKKNRAVTRLHRTGSRAIRRRAIRGIRRAIRRIGVSAIRLRANAAARESRDPGFRGFTRRPVASRRRRARPRRNDARRLAFAPRARVEPTTHRKMTSDSARRRERPRRSRGARDEVVDEANTSRRPRRNRRVFFRDSPPRNVARRITHPPSRKLVGRSLSSIGARGRRGGFDASRESGSPPNARRRSETRDWRRAQTRGHRARVVADGHKGERRGTKGRCGDASARHRAHRRQSRHAREHGTRESRVKRRTDGAVAGVECEGWPPARVAHAWSQVILFWWIKMVCFI